MNIAAYCRVSTDKTDQLNSLETQKRFFDTFTRQNGHHLVRLYADEGISGTKIKNRRQFLQLMRDAQTGLFQMVVVKDISRFARNTVDFLQSIRTLKALGIETQFLTANMTSMGNSEFILTIFGALAQEESANTSKRIKFGKRLNAARGRVPNLVYGYDKLSRDCFSLAVNPAEAAIVRRIYSWYINDGRGTTVIANALNASGLRTKRGCPWTSSAVRRILINPLYTGTVVNGRQEVADFLTGRRQTNDASRWLVTQQPSLCVIPAADFERAQQILHTRGQAIQTKQTRHSGQHLFSTLIRCKICGRSFRRTVRTYKNTYVRWVCSGHNGHGADCCLSAVTVDESVLIGALQEYFLSLLRGKKNALQQIRGRLCRSLSAAVQADPGTRKRLLAALESCRRKKQKYMDLCVQDLITKEELDCQLTALRRDIQQLESEISRLPETASDPLEPESLVQSLFPTLESAADIRLMRNAQLKRIISRIEIGPDGTADVYLQSPAEGRLGNVIEI